MAKAAFSLLIILWFASYGQSRFFSETDSDLVSDGIPHVHQPSVLHLGRPSSSTDTCDQTYGFLPCTTTVLGNIFLMLAYGYLMLVGAKCLSSGSELLLNILGPGIIGGLFLPVLGALPDALLILVSGLSGSKETAQSQVSIGMGLLAGSTVMLLTLLWGSCVVVGKCNLSGNSTSSDSQDLKWCSSLTVMILVGYTIINRLPIFSGSGVTTDKSTSHAATIMVISVIPFFIVQLQTFVKSSSGKRIAILVSLVVSVAFLLSYCLYQVYETWIQERRLEYAKLKLVMAGFIIRCVKKDPMGPLLTEDGKPNRPVLVTIFKNIDLDSNDYISTSELRALIVGLKSEMINKDIDDTVKKVMDEFDTSGDRRISMEEFIDGFSNWLTKAKRTVPSPSSFSRKFANDFYVISEREYAILTDESEDVIMEDVIMDNAPVIWFKAASLLLLGTVIAAAFADPLVDAVNNFSTATSIPSFFISFIAMPLATNASEAVSAIIFASRKKKRTTSLTFSEIYGSATMNNTLCLAVFLALVYFRNLTWDFSAEVLVILIVCIVMGLSATFFTTFQLWTCSLAFLLYPFSLALVYVLDYCFGWS